MNRRSEKNLGTHEVDGFGSGLLVVGAPGLAPEPVLRERLDAHLMDHVVRQVLIEVRQAVRVRRERLVLAAQAVASRDPPEAHQVHHVQC